MAEKMSEVYEMYDFTIQKSSRGRGFLRLETDLGIMQLKKLGVSENRLRTEHQLKERLAELGFDRIDRLVENKNGELVSLDRYGNEYVMRRFFDGKEMNVASRQEIVAAVENLARFHLLGREIWQQTEGDVLLREKSDARRRNRELKRVHAFIAKKSPKKEFEEIYMQAFPTFYEQGLSCEEQQQERPSVHMGYCHGSYNHHSVLFCESEGEYDFGGGSIATINFDRFYVGNQLRDLYHFLRKTVEKNGYQYGVLELILHTYGARCPLSEADIEYIFRLYCYPEKFYKLSNQYMNSAKNWISPKSVEKLKQIMEDEPKKQELLQKMFENKNNLIER